METPAPYRPTESRGVTALEALIVLAILGIVIALLTPSLQQAMKPAAQVRCVSNLRQIGVATLLYAADHGGRLPLPYSGNYPNAGNPNGLGGNPAMQGFVGLFPYLAPEGGRQAVIQTFHCPGSPVSLADRRVSWANLAVISASYIQYCGWGPDGGNSGFFLNSRDFLGQHQKSRLLYLDVTTRDSQLSSNHRTPGGAALGANALDVSGSVSWIPASELTLAVRRFETTYLFPDPAKTQP